MAKNQVVLIGNGPSRAAGNVSWPTLLRRVFSHVVGHPWPLSFRDAPYPLIYEQLLLEARRRLNWRESDLKQYIAAQINTIRGGAIHSEIMNLPVSDVLTTNYDQALEEVAPRPQDGLNQGEIAERRYSLFRHRVLESGPRLWYLHGDARVPGSILLGYEQYSGYLQQMRLYATRGIEYRSRTIEPLFMGDKLVSRDLSWVDLFFTADVWIMGLGMEFVEMHLWWLLTFRARQKALKRSVTNRVIYLCHASDAGAGSKHAMLRGFSVDVRVIGSPNLSYESFYFRCVETIRDAA